MPLFQFFRLVDIQARMALKADASKYALGYIWWVLEPLLYVAVFYVVFSIILNSGRDDFLVFLMCGKLPFMWFSKSVTQASNSIVANSGLIGKVDIPKAIFPMAILQECLYKQGAVFLLLFVVLVAWGYPVTPAWAWMVPIILTNYLLIVACALIGAYVVCLMRDFSMFISLGMVFLLFTSGVFWDVRALDSAQMTNLVLTCNPLAFLLDAYRQVLMNGVAPDALHLGVLAALFAAVIVGMLYLMRSTSQYLALKALTA